MSDYLQIIDLVQLAKIRHTYPDKYLSNNKINQCSIINIYIYISTQKQTTHHNQLNWYGYIVELFLEAFIHLDFERDQKCDGH